jgi:hypothetical protein
MRLADEGVGNRSGNLSADFLAEKAPLPHIRYLLEFQSCTIYKYMHNSTAAADIFDMLRTVCQIFTLTEERNYFY